MKKHLAYMQGVILFKPEANVRTAFASFPTLIFLMHGFWTCVRNDSGKS